MGSGIERWPGWRTCLPACLPASHWKGGGGERPSTMPDGRLLTARRGAATLRFACIARAEPGPERGRGSIAPPGSSGRKARFGLRSSLLPFRSSRATSENERAREGARRAGGAVPPSFVRRPPSPPDGPSQPEEPSRPCRRRRRARGVGTFPPSLPGQGRGQGRRVRGGGGGGGGRDEAGGGGALPQEEAAEERSDGRRAGSLALACGWTGRRAAAAAAGRRPWSGGRSLACGDLGGRSGAGPTGADGGEAGRIPATVFRPFRAGRAVAWSAA